MPTGKGIYIGEASSGRESATPDRCLQERRSRQVLECDAEVLMVGVPGLALPDSALATAMLPSVPDMVDASIANSRLARKVAQQPPTPKSPTKHANCECPFSWMQCKICCTLHP